MNRSGPKSVSENGEELEREYSYRQRSFRAAIASNHRCVSSRP